MNSGNSSKIDDNPVVGGDNKKVDRRMNSGDKNIIHANSWIGGNSTLGDNSGKSSNTMNNSVVKRNTKSDNKSGCHNSDSGDKNVIGPNSQIGGNSILGDNSGKIDDNPVLGDSNNTKSNNDGVNNILNSLRQLAGFNLDNCEVDFRVNSGDKNIIGANCEIQGDSIVGDGSGNNTMNNSVVERNNTMNESVAESKNTMNSNKTWQRQQQTQQQQQKKAAATTVPTKSAEGWNLTGILPVIRPFERI